MSMQLFEYVETYFLVLMRVAGIFSSAPVIGSETMPTQIRIAAAFVFSLVMLPVQYAASGAVKIPSETVIFVLVVVKEVLFGILLGFVANFTIEGIKLAGEIMGTQLGFGMVSVIDPDSQQEESIIGSLNFLIFTLVFLGMNGHHLIVKAVAQSFGVVPLGLVNYTKGFVGEIVDRAPEFFIVAVKIAAPVVLPLIMMTIVLGIISKAVPRLEVFMLSFPVNIFLGFSVMMFFMHDLIIYMGNMTYTHIYAEIIRLMGLLR